MHIKLSDGNRIFYRESGVKSADNILLLHGNLCSSAVWERVLRGNLSKTYHLFAPDLPGHGQSDNAPNPKETYTTLGFGRALSLFVSAMKIGKFSVIGHSLGGHIAIEAWPDSLPAERIMVFGTPPLGLPLDMAAIFLPNPLIPVLFTIGMNREQATPIAASWLRSTTDPQLKHVVDDLVRVDDEFRKRIGESLAAADDILDELKVLSSIKKPICIAHAELDDWINGDYLRKLTVPMYKTRVQIFPACGHIPQWENEPSVTGLAQEFFASR